MTFHTKKSLVLAAMAMMIASVGAGCSSKPKDLTASAKVAVSVESAATIAEVTTIKVIIDDAGNAPSIASPITALLTKAPAGNTWTANITSIPASAAPGSIRRFKAQALNASSVVIYEGDTLATVIAGQTASITIIMQEKNVPPGPTNYGPAITSLTNTNSYVLPGQTGTASVTAVDPDNNGNPLTYGWSASCTNGVLLFGSATAATTTWTAPTGFDSSVCTVAIRVSESATAGNNNLPLSVTTYFTITVNNLFGNANIAAFPNSYPIVTVKGDFRYNFFTDVTTIPVGQQGDLFFHAVDPDGDNVRFDVSVRCKDDTSTPPQAWFATDPAYLSAVTFTSTGGTVAPPAARAFDFNPTWGVATRVPNPFLDCEFKVTVQDLCTAGNCGAAGAQGSLPNGADKVTLVDGVSVKSVTTGFINATHPAKPKRAPVMVRLVAPNQLGGAATGVQTWDPQKVAIVETSTEYLLQAEADDRYEGGTLLPTWNCNTGGVVSPGPINTGNLSTSAKWTSPATLVGGMNCTVTFTSVGATGSGLSVVGTFQFASSDPCVSLADGTACVPSANLCIQGATCQNKVCTGGTVNPCTDNTTCHVNGACNPATGICATQFAAVTVGCDDLSGCTTGDHCDGAGACAAGAAVACTTPTDAVCQKAIGACVSTGSASHTCSYAPVDGTPSCNADNTGCTQNDVCSGGVCVAGAAVQCAQSANSCLAAVGTCANDPSFPDFNHTTCTFAPLTGQVCVASADACTNDRLCDATGQCGAAAPKCTGADTSCVVVGATGTCLVNTQVPTFYRDVKITAPAGIAMDTSGYTYLAGAVSGVATIDYGSAGNPVSLKPSGGADIFLAKYDSSGNTVFAAMIGDDGATPTVSVNSTQTAKGAAVSANGTVAVIGTLGGKVTFGANVLQPASTLPFIGAIDGSTVTASAAAPARKWAKSINLGGSGQFRSIAANPSSSKNLFAVCGVTNIAATDLVPGATLAGNSNAVLAVIDSSGVVQWSVQLGATNNTNCSAVTIDDSGSVVAAGQFDGATLTFPGTTPVSVTSPGSTSNKYMWVAKFAAACPTSATPCSPQVQAAKAFSSSANVTPNALTTDSSGNVLVAGSFTGDISTTGMLGGALLNQGSEDAFAVKLDSNLAASWSSAVQLGGGLLDKATGIAATALGDALYIGTFQDILTVGPTFTSFGSTDIFVEKLNGSTGALQYAYQYGDPSSQSGDAIVVNRYGTGSAKNLITLATTVLGTPNFGGLVGAQTTTSTDVVLIFSKYQAP